MYAIRTSSLEHFMISPLTSPAPVHPLETHRRGEDASATPWVCTKLFAGRTRVDRHRSHDSYRRCDSENGIGERL